MPIRFSCVHCGARLEAPDDDAGNVRPCPKCGGKVRSPGKLGAEPPPGPCPAPVEGDAAAEDGFDDEFDDESESEFGGRIFGERESRFPAGAVIKWACAILFLAGGVYFAVTTFTGQKSDDAAPKQKSKVDEHAILMECGKLRRGAVDLWNAKEFDDALKIYDEIVEKVSLLSERHQEAIEDYQLERDFVAAKKTYAEMMVERVARRAERLKLTEPDEAAPQDEAGEDETGEDEASEDDAEE